MYNNLTSIIRTLLHRDIWLGTFEHEKTLLEMGTKVAHSRSKTKTRRRFSALFGAVSAQ